MVGQHDPARADSNTGGAARNKADNHGCGSTGYAAHVVVFGNPEPLRTQSLGVLSEVKTVAQGNPCGTTLVDGCQVKN